MIESPSSRFPFGRNWADFLRLVDEARIVEAERSLTEMLGPERIAGATFLDAGSGSGLFSLAAMRLGAGRVHSFDIDHDSVACTVELRRRFYPQTTHWTIEQGDVLNQEYVARLGLWDIVYAWGVLHHTGDLWRAFDAVTRMTAPSGQLFVSIYNDWGVRSRLWRSVKRFYNTGRLGRAAVRSVFIPWYVARGLAIDLVRRRSPRARYDEYRTSRGMSMTHDWDDWLGGYPYEVARPEQIIEFCSTRDCSLLKSILRRGNGCNEFVFTRIR